MTKYILGVDVGLNGAFALYDKKDETIIIVDMPVHELTINGKKKKRIDIYEAARFIDQYADKIKQAYVEDVWSSPQQGVTSAFSFGMSARVSTWHYCG